MGAASRHRARGHGRRSRHGRHGNPADLDRFVARQLAPDRGRWQRPDAVVRALRLRRGEVVADVGAGPGYFALRLARAVGPRGHVFAVDPEPAVLEVLAERLARTRLRNVTPVLGSAGDPRLPAGRCDLVLVVNAYHHFADGPAFLERLAAALVPGGRLVNIDWDARETPKGPPPERRVPREVFLRAARRAGLRPAGEPVRLPYQYAVALRRR